MYTLSEYTADVAAIKTNIEKSNLYHVPQVERMLENFLRKYFYSAKAHTDAEALRATLNARHIRVPAHKNLLTA